MAPTADSNFPKTLRTVAELHDETGLLPGEVYLALYESAHRWSLTVGRDGVLVRFSVGGEVFPLRPDGTRAKRGKRPFFGGYSPDAVKALYFGLQALREVESAGIQRRCPSCGGKVAEYRAVPEFDRCEECGDEWPVRET